MKGRHSSRELTHVLLVTSLLSNLKNSMKNCVVSFFQMATAAFDVMDHGMPCVLHQGYVGWQRGQCFYSSVVWVEHTMHVSESSFPIGISWHVPSVVAGPEWRPRCCDGTSSRLLTRTRSSSVSSNITWWVAFPWPLRRSRDYALPWTCGGSEPCDTWVIASLQWDWHSGFPFPKTSSAIGKTLRRVCPWAWSGTWSRACSWCAFLTS